MNHEIVDMDCDVHLIDAPERHEPSVTCFCGPVLVNVDHIKHERIFLHKTELELCQ